MGVAERQPLFNNRIVAHVESLAKQRLANNSQLVAAPICNKNSAASETPLFDSCWNSDKLLERRSGVFCLARSKKHKGVPSVYWSCDNSLVAISIGKVQFLFFEYDM